MAKTAVYSWRLAPDLKHALEEAARSRGENMAETLERIARDWLSRTPSDDEGEQRRLHAAAVEHVGILAGGDPDRSIKVRETVRARLAHGHGRAS